jgi:hypothetical protein
MHGEKDAGGLLDIEFHCGTFIIKVEDVEEVRGAVEICEVELGYLQHSL